MRKPWAELTSAERLDAILMAVSKLPDGEGTAARIAMQVQALGHRMESPRYASVNNAQRGRQPSDAVRVTPGIMALRKRGLIGFVRRCDGLSGSADALTDAGAAELLEVRRRRSV